MFNTTELKKSHRFEGGFLVGMGTAFIIFGIGFWLIISEIVDVLASWLEEQGYTMAPSGISALNKIPIVSMAMLAFGFVSVLIGVMRAMRAKD